MAEDFNGQRLTLKTGRVIEGIYSEEKGKVEIISETGSRMTLAVKKEDVAKVENVVLKIQIITKAEQEMKRRRLERTGAQLNLKRVSEELAAISGTPSATMDRHKKRIPEVQEALKLAATQAVEIRKIRDDYKRQVALRESSTTTTKVTDTATKVDVVTEGGANTTGGYGDDWWTKYRERTTGWGNKREVSIVTKEVTADAARAELSKLDQEVSQVETAISHMTFYVKFLETEISKIETLSGEKLRWEKRLLELDKIIDGSP